MNTNLQNLPARIPRAPLQHLLLLRPEHGVQLLDGLVRAGALARAEDDAQQELLAPGIAVDADQLGAPGDGRAVRALDRVDEDAVALGRGAGAVGEVVRHICAWRALGSVLQGRHEVGLTEQALHAALSCREGEAEAHVAAGVVGQTAVGVGDEVDGHLGSLQCRSLGCVGMAGWEGKCARDGAGEGQIGARMG